METHKGVIKKNSQAYFKKKDGTEVVFDLGSAMPVGVGDVVDLNGDEFGLQGQFRMVDKKTKYDIEGEIHQLDIGYFFEEE